MLRMAWQNSALNVVHDGVPSKDPVDLRDQSHRMAMVSLGFAGGRPLLEVAVGMSESLLRVPALKP